MKRPPAPYTQRHPDGSVQVLRRRLLNGQTVPRPHVTRTWEDVTLALVGGRRAPAGASRDASHPSRKHDVDVRQQHVRIAVPGPIPGQPRRRDRRVARRSAAPQAREAA